jgi:hypothetical protein
MRRPPGPDFFDAHAFLQRTNAREVRDSVYMALEMLELAKSSCAYDPHRIQSPSGLVAFISYTYAQIS